MFVANPEISEKAMQLCLWQHVIVIWSLIFKCMLNTDAN